MRILRQPQFLLLKEAVVVCISQALWSGITPCDFSGKVSSQEWTSEQKYCTDCQVWDKSWLSWIEYYIIALQRSSGIRFFLQPLISQVSIAAVEYVRKARLAPGQNSSESKAQDFWTLSQASLNWAFRLLFPKFLVRIAGNSMIFVQFIVSGLQVFLFPNCKNSIKWIWIFPLVHKLQNLFQLSQNTQLKKTLHFDFEYMLLNM